VTCSEGQVWFEGATIGVGTPQAFSASLNRSGSSTRVGRSIRLYGAVAPWWDAASRSAYLYKKTGRTWRRAATLRPSSVGSLSRYWTESDRGGHYFKVYMPATNACSACWSRAIYVLWW